MVGIENSFYYIASRTLMRPRDLLNFLHRAIEISINRNHGKVDESDIRKAQEIYSEDLLLATSFEIQDVFPGARDPLYAFLGCPKFMERNEILLRLIEAGVEEGKKEDALNLLLWFGFLGIHDPEKDETKYSYQVRYNIDKITALTRKARSRFMVHPAYWEALECK
jgi:hypothetical protein